MSVAWHFAANFHQLILAFVVLWLLVGVFVGIFKLMFASECDVWSRAPFRARLLFSVVLIFRCAI